MKIRSSLQRQLPHALGMSPLLSSKLMFHKCDCLPNPRETKSPTICRISLKLPLSPRQSKYPTETSPSPPFSPASRRRTFSLRPPSGRPGSCLGKRMERKISLYELFSHYLPKYAYLRFFSGALVSVESVVLAGREGVPSPLLGLFSNLSEVRASVSQGLVQAHSFFVFLLLLFRWGLPPSLLWPESAGSFHARHPKSPPPKPPPNIPNLQHPPPQPRHPRPFFPVTA